MIFWSVVFAFAILVMSTLVASGRAQNCNPVEGLDGVCKCRLPNSTFLDLTPLKMAIIVVKHTKYVYRYSPCTPFTWNTKGKTEEDIGTCTKERRAAVCQEIPASEGGGHPSYTLCGRLPSNGQPFITCNKTSCNAFYGGGQEAPSGNRTAHVQLVCNHSLEHSLSVVNDVNLDYRLRLRSKYACARTPAPDTSRKRLSTGSILCIVFFSLLFVYFVGGMVFMHFVKGASGQEMVPNVDFWKALPGYIKDGGVFICSACPSRGSGGYEKL